MSSSGETSLSEILKSLNPELNPGEFVFITLDLTNENSKNLYNQLKSTDPSKIILEFREQEGQTIILDKTLADQFPALSYDLTLAWITLKVHSSLAAVGLTAKFSQVLTEENISCNVVAGFYHDHIFVDVSDGRKAVDVLRRLSEK